MAGLPSLDLEILTDRLLLRPMRVSDAAHALCAWTGDVSASEMLNVPRRSWSVEEQRSYFRTFEKTRRKLLWGIFAKGEPDAVGLFIMNISPENSTFLVSHLIGNVEWRGKGASREAINALLEYFFQSLGYVKAKCNVRPHNKPVLWALLSVGWRKEAYLKQHLRLSGVAERADLVLLATLADEWRERNTRLIAAKVL